MKESLKKLLNVENLNGKIITQVIHELEAQGCKWRNLGDIELNHARVNIVANPELTIIERITNAMDASLERNALNNHDISKAINPRVAVSKMLGTPDGYLSHLSDSQVENLIKEPGVEVFVKVNDNVNLFFRDHGIGLTSMEMPSTILSLNESNKFRKPYLIGQYGQGGSTTCAFSEYTVIVSRKASVDNDHIGFTIIRFNPLVDDVAAKDGKYEYLVQTSVAPNNIPPYIAPIDIDFPYGTLVMHLNYGTEISKGFINYYQMLDNFLFDPPLNYSLFYDKWKSGSKRNLLGARRRIETSPALQYSQEYTYKVAENPLFGEIKIRYWLLKKAEEKEKNKKMVLEIIQANKFLYEEKNPILITYNGQVQGMLARTLLKDDCKFGYIYKSLIVQIECEGLTPGGKKFFFTSGRDRLKVPAEKEVTSALITILSKDETLLAENEKREQESLSEKVGKDTTEIRKKLAEMLNRLNPGKFKITLANNQKSNSEKGTKGTRGGKTRHELPPLPTKEEPTFIKIVNHQDPMPIQKGRTCKLLLESDAPDNLITNKGWTLFITENSSEQLSIYSNSEFKGGRTNIFLKCDESTKIGKMLNVQIAMKNPAGKIIVSNTRSIEVREPTLSDKNNQMEINAPNIIPLTEGHPRYTEFGWNDGSVSEVREGAETAIYVNMSNRFLVNMLREGGYAEARANRIKSQFLLHIAYHSFIQKMGFKESELKLGEDSEERVKRDEMDRVARTVCTTIMAMPDSD
jgi:hypothetical protein